MYLSMLRNAGPRIAAVLRVIAEAGTHPVVFHCAAGKDRTGLVAAVLLSVLGVSDDDVVADYAMTDEIMDEMRARARARAEAMGRSLREVPPHVVRAEDATMRRLLQLVRDEHGSVSEYLERHGIDDATIDRLRSHLVVR
jgi:protein-tyrosine phosphatase